MKKPYNYRGKKFKRPGSKLEPMDAIFSEHPFFTKRPIISVYKLQKHWQSLVGEMMAKRSQPVRVKNGCLVIAVENQAWGQQFAMMKRVLLQAIKDKLQLDYEDIRFVSEKFKKIEHGPPKSIKTRAKEDKRSLADILKDIAPNVGSKAKKF